MNFFSMKLKDIGKELLKSEKNFVDYCEENYSSQIDEVVMGIIRKINKQNNHITVVLLAGPSCSGKTTSSNIIMERLEVHGIDTHTLSLDDFILDERTLPVLEDGRVDFESVNTLDIPFIKRVFDELDKDHRADVPVYNFKRRRRETELRHIDMTKSGCLIVEGLHAINPLLTEGLDPDIFVKLFFSLEGEIKGEKRTLSNLDIRLVRRLVRDFKFRNATFNFTMHLWAGVVEGENLYVYPFKKDADFVINTFLPYEVGAIKDEFLTILENSEIEVKYQEKLNMLRDFFEPVPSVGRNLIRKDSILIEFLGKS